MENEFKEILKSMRKESGLTQKQVAKEIQKSETGYASWEQGLSEPGISDIKKLCKLFNANADELLGIK